MVRVLMNAGGDLAASDGQSMYGFFFGIIVTAMLLILPPIIGGIEKLFKK